MSEMVKEPKAFRYLWNWRGRGRLQNSVGLPLTPIPPTSVTSNGVMAVELQIPRSDARAS